MPCPGYVRCIAPSEGMRVACVSAAQLAGTTPVAARADAVGCLWSLAMIDGVAADVVAVAWC